MALTIGRYSCSCSGHKDREWGARVHQPVCHLHHWGWWLWRKEKLTTRQGTLCGPFTDCIPNSQSHIPKASFPNPHSKNPHSQSLIPKILISKTSFSDKHPQSPWLHSQNALPIPSTSFLNFTPSFQNSIFQLHPQFWFSLSLLLVRKLLHCLIGFMFQFYSQQCVSLTEALMPLCSTRLSPPRQPSIVSMVTTTLSILMQTSPS